MTTLQTGTKVLIEATVELASDTHVRLKTKTNDFLAVRLSDLTVCETSEEKEPALWKVHKSDPDFEKVYNAIKNGFDGEGREAKYDDLIFIGKGPLSVTWTEEDRYIQAYPTITGQQALKLLGVKPQPIDLNNFCIDITDPVNAELLPGFKEWYRKNCNWDDPTPLFSHKHYGVKVGDFSFWGSLHKPPVCTLPDLQKQHPGVFEPQQNDEWRPNNGESKVEWTKQTEWHPTTSFKAGQEPTWTDEDIKRAQQAILCNHKDAVMNENFALEFLRPIPAQPTVESEIRDWVSGIFVESKQNERICQLLDIFNRHQKHSGRVEVSVPSDEEILDVYMKTREGSTEKEVIKTVRHFMTRKEQQG